MLACVGPRLRRPLRATEPVDFNVYYSAAVLVRQGQAASLYTGADTGVNPQKLAAPADSPLSLAAHARGLTYVALYVYPPLLADLMLPLTALPPRQAADTWLWVNLAFLFITGLLTVKLLDLRWRSPATAAIFVAVFCFTPVLQCLHDGQITVMLLLLWTAGLLFYRRDQMYAAGLIFALATAIKLTPALVLAPVLLWRQWRLVGAYLVSLAAFAAICVRFDTWHSSLISLTRVIPAMSVALPYYTNYSLAAALERFLALCRHTTLMPDELSHLTLLGAKAVSAAVLLITCAVIAIRRPAADRREQVMALGLFSLLAPILSPVSWFHAYAMSFAAFVLLWAECFRRPVGSAYLALLTIVSLLLGTAVSENALQALAGPGTHLLSAATLQLGQLLAAVSLILYRLWRTGTFGNTESLPAQA